MIILSFIPVLVVPVLTGPQGPLWPCACPKPRVKKEGWWRGADAATVKNRPMKFKLQVKKSEWKNTEIWNVKVKAIDTNTGFVCAQDTSNGWMDQY